MRRKWMSMAAIVLAGLTLAADEPGLTVKMKRLTEDRVVELQKTNNPHASIGSMTYMMTVEGADLAGARKAGRVKVSKAVDDLGTDLLALPLGTPVFRGDSFTPVRGYNAAAGRPVSFDMEVRMLGVPSRTAKEIKLIEGSFEVLAGGERKTISVRLKDQIGKPVEDADLKAQGITFTPRPPGSGEGLAADPNALPVDIQGDLLLLEDVSIEAGDGEKINSGLMIFGPKDGPKRYSYSLERAVDEKTILKITLFAGQKRVTVPFKFEGLKLP